jgi:hypothetical protein
LNGFGRDANSAAQLSADWQFLPMIKAMDMPTNADTELMASAFSDELLISRLFFITMRKDTSFHTMMTASVQLWGSSCGLPIFLILS